MIEPRLDTVSVGLVLPSAVISSFNCDSNLGNQIFTWTGVMLFIEQLACLVQWYGCPCLVFVLYNPLIFLLANLQVTCATPWVSLSNHVMIEPPRLSGLILPY